MQQVYKLCSGLETTWPAFYDLDMDSTFMEYIILPFYQSWFYQQWPSLSPSIPHMLVIVISRLGGMYIPTGHDVTGFYLPMCGRIKGTGSHSKSDTAPRAKRRACISLWCLIHALVPGSHAGHVSPALLVAGHVSPFDVWYMPWHCYINIRITGKFPHT